jgi:hypothetical protein
MGSPPNVAKRKSPGRGLETPNITFNYYIPPRPPNATK